MNTEFLARFLVVAQHGNITRAAHSLHLSQSTLSKQMMALEEEFGTLLLLRSNRNVELTEAGRLLYEQAGPLVESFQQLKLRMQALRPAGVLRVATETISNLALNRFYRRFRAENPEVELVTSHVYYDGVVDRFFRGEADLGIVRGYEFVGAAFEREFDSLPLFSSDSVLRLSSDHPLAGRSSVRLEELRGETFVYLRHLKQVGSRYFPDLIRRAGGVCAPELPAQFDDLMSMVAGGEAVAFAERQSAMEIGRGTTYVEVEDADTRFDFLIIWQKNRQSPLRDLFLRELRHALPEIRKGGVCGA